MGLCERLIETYRGWDAFERSGASQPLEVIDFDLAPDTHPVTAIPRETVLRTLEALLPEASAFHELLGARVRASIAYLEASLGQPCEFDRYIRVVLGISPQPISRSRQQAQRGRVEELLDEWRVPYRREARDQFVTKLTLQTDEIILKELKSAVPACMARVRAQLGLDTDVTPDWQTVRQDAYWKTWVSSRSGQSWRISVNTQKRRPFYRGEPLLLGYHEGAAHILQMATWARRIAAGELSTAFGITTVHSPEQFVSEGLALTITDCLLDDDELPRETVFSREYDRHRLFVYHNAHIDVNRGAAEAEVIESCYEQLPFETREAIQSEIHQRLRNPLLRAYQLAYSAGDLYCLDHIVPRKLDERIRILRRMYSDPMTPGGLAALVQGNAQSASA